MGMLRGVAVYWPESGRLDGRVRECSERSNEGPWEHVKVSEVALRVGG